MIQEIVNYTKYLKEKSPKVFEDGLENNDESALCKLCLSWVFYGR